MDDGDRESTKASGAQWIDGCLGWHFWRFDIELELSAEQRPVRYTVTPPGGGADVSATFYVPGEKESWHWGYTSCNGISHGKKDRGLGLTTVWITIYLLSSMYLKMLSRMMPHAYAVVILLLILILRLLSILFA